MNHVFGDGVYLQTAKTGEKHICRVIAVNNAALSSAENNAG
jgi:hypothetical protein